MNLQQAEQIVKALHAGRTESQLETIMASVVENYNSNTVSERTVGIISNYSLRTFLIEVGLGLLHLSLLDSEYTYDDCKQIMMFLKLSLSVDKHGNLNIFY